MSRKSVTRSAVQIGAGLACVYALWSTLRRTEERAVNANLAQGKRILVLGGGFAGTGVAQELARLLPAPATGEIILIDEDNYLLFTPMLTEAAGGELETRHIVSSLRTMEPRIRFVQGRILSVDLANRQVEIETGAADLDPAKQTFQADHLVIALGSVVNFHGTPGVEANAIPMKKLHDSRVIFQRISDCLERASMESDRDKRKKLLTFVVAGGGFTGVETMAAVNDFIRASARRQPGIPEEDVRTILVQPGDRLLPELSPELARYATEKLKQRKVEIQLNIEVAGANEGVVELKDGEKIAAHTLIWAAGVTPNPLIDTLPAAKGKHHGLEVDGCCRVTGHAGVWALGDCAEIPKPDGHGTYAPTAQNATREGKLVAQNIIRTLRGEAPQPFRYTPVGELALVGRHSGVARIYGHNFSGPLAWAMWRAIYLAKMPSVAQRGRILGDWLLDSIFGRVPVPLSTADPKLKS